jgi:capsular exopolysaccharide synthesis family protein
MANTADTVDRPEGPATVNLAPKAEEVFRGLWASLYYSGRGVGKSIMVCSADCGEGASTVACGLALAGSAPNGTDRVALVDFNLRKPSLHRLLRANQSPGVCQVLSGQLAPESAAQRVNVVLDFYAAGEPAQRGAELLRGPAISDFLATLADGYDHVLVDAPAVNRFPDAGVLAGIVKDVVLVAHAERTPREAVAAAKKHLESAGARLVGVVLNQRTYPIPSFLYRRV